MKKIRIAFIEPRAEGLNIFSRYNLPRLGCVLLATIMKEKGYDTEVFFIYEKELAKLQITCDIAAISTITPTATQAYRIADHFKAQGTTVIMGGPHVTFMAEEALGHADYCVLGEAEEALPPLVDAIVNGQPCENVPNSAYLVDGKVFLTEKKPFDAHLDTLPFPDFSLLNYGKHARVGKLFLKTIVPIQTSRGCPYDCTFCSVTGMFGKRYRFRSTESVIQEVARYNPKKHKIFFYDDNFAANRKRTKELLKAMIGKGFQFTWSTQVRTEIARDPELLSLMYQAGCRVLFIGFESVDPESLAAMKKSQTADDIRAAIREIQSHGIHVHGMFVFGFDTDTKASIRATIRFAIREKIDSAQFMILTPLPGSDFHKEMEEQGRIISHDWNKFDAHHVAFRPNKLSITQLQFLQIEAHTRFYSPWNVLRKLFRSRWGAFIIGMYAHKLNQKWLRAEKLYLAALRGITHRSLPAESD